MLLAVGAGSFSDRAPELVQKAHVGESALHAFGWLAVMFLVALTVRGGGARVVTAGGIVLIGIAVEVTQPLLSVGRNFEGGDIAANLVGVAIGLVLGLVIGGAADRREQSLVSESAVAS